MPDMLYRQLIELSDDCVKQLDLEGRILAVNEPGLKLLGATAAQLVGRAWDTMWPIAAQPVVAAACEAARLGRSSRFVAETVDADVRRWWTVLTGPLRDMSGTVVGIGAVSRDITQRLQLEEAMDTLNESLRERLTMAERSVRYSDEQAAVLENELEAATKAILAVDEANTVLQAELDGAEVARRAAERIANQSQKAAAVGQMVAGLAHDFNNNLQTIMSALEALSASESSMSAKQQRFLAYAEQAARHASGNAKRLLAFSRSHPYQPEYLDLWAVVSEVLPLISATLGAKVTVQADPYSEALHTFADPHAFQQALMNLAINARDACDGCGTIVVRLGEESVPEGQISSTLGEGEYVFVELTDDGAGMSAEVLERMFEPFFTTKPEGKGTGLGMAQVLGFAQQASGTARIVSEVGKGTTVRLLFPKVSMLVEA